MPRAVFPLTPGSSTDIKGQDGSQNLSALHLAFELPPPAIYDAARASSTDYKQSSTRAPGAAPQITPTRQLYPMQAAETVKSRRRSSAAREQKEDAFALPPPPTRSRKIIQMKPKAQEDDQDDETAGNRQNKAGKAPASAGKSSNVPKEQGKKKQPSATSAAGRKIARKTAHSLIERRRRSKMNEEFALLKSMIPACTGEMHKLAILQASIDYVRYLEDCVAKLKAQHVDNMEQNGDRALPSIRDFHPTFREDDALADVEMSDTGTASPPLNAEPEVSRHPSESPALYAQDSRHRQPSLSSASTDRRHYSFSTSATTSPAIGPQHTSVGYAASNASASGSTLTSPALGPQTDIDQEATAALLMLNTDRRGVPSGGRGMSVRDLLSA